ncbi:cubilin-like isoform X3 [Littorina saxatilis]|uniref:cubilin-like isoform X3 n=1 Tax=Littorina saxatilis TaxID=31220 RepID=UPI0038B479E4
MMVMLEEQVIVLWLCTAGLALGILSQQLSQQNCDVTISTQKGAARNGTFESPGFPLSYPDNVHCLYKFIGRDDQRVRIRFTYFALQGRYPLCENDFVDVYAQLQDEHEDLLDADLTGRFCGESMDNLPQLIVSTSNLLVLSFFTNDAKTNRGFQGSFEFFDDTVYQIGTEAPPRICGYTVRSEVQVAGYIVSPTYPGMYPDNLYCYYKLEGKLGQRIRIRFEEFILFHGGEYCPFDYVKIYDGHTIKSPVIGTFCGRYNASTVLFSTREALFFEFRTGQGRIEFGKPLIEQEADFSFDRKGFNITYEFSDEFVSLGFITGEATHVLGTECDQRILSQKESQGTITSPGYPANFQQGMLCHYYLDGLMDRQNLEKVKVDFTDFNIPGNMPYCAIGYIGQQEDTLLGRGEVKEKFCGNLRPPTLFSKGPRMVLALNTNAAVKGGKFVAKYKFITDYAIPGNSITEGKCLFHYESKLTKSGTFNSPRYPAKYPDKTQCEYILRPLAEEVLIINFDVLMFPETQVRDPNCRGSDYVAIYEEYRSNNYTMTERYCDKDFLPGPYATRNVVKVVFFSNDKDSNVGFKASFKFVTLPELSKRCDRHDIQSPGSGGKISSPQYPHKYSPLTACEWTVHASQPTHKILMEFTDLNMEGSATNCQHAVLKVYDDRNALRPMASLCGKYTERIAFTSARNSLTLRFITSPASLGARGFAISWTEILAPENCVQFQCAVNKYCISTGLKCNGDPNCGEDDDSDETAECPKSGGVKILHIAIGTSISSFFCIILLICGFYHHRKFRTERAPPDHDHVEVRYVSAPTGCNTTDRLLMEDRNDQNNTLTRNTDSPRCQKVSMV